MPSSSRHSMPSKSFFLPGSGDHVDGDTSVISANRLSDFNRLSPRNISSQHSAKGPRTPRLSSPESQGHSPVSGGGSSSNHDPASYAELPGPGSGPGESSSSSPDASKLQLYEFIESELSSHKSSGEFSQGNASTISPDKEIKRQRDVAKMASVLMNMKYAHLGEMQDSEPAGAWPILRSVTPEETPAHHKSALHVTAATRSRVSRAKAYFQLKYQMVESFQQPVTVEMADGITESKEIPGVYNPLQVLRDRRENKAAQALVENSRFLTPKAWTIDPTELVRDWAWRARNLTLLRDRKGRHIYGAGNSKRDYKLYTEGNGNELVPTVSAGSAGKSYVDSKVDMVKRRLHRKAGSSHETDSSLSKSDLSDAEDLYMALGSGAASKRGHSPVRDVPIERGQRPNIVLEVTPDSPTRAKQAFESSVSITSREVDTKPASISEVSKRDVSPIERTNRGKSRSQSRDRNDAIAARYNKELFYVEAVFKLAVTKYTRIISDFEKLAQPDTALASDVSDSAELSAHVNTKLVSESDNFINQKLPNVNDLRTSMVYHKLPKMDSILSESDRILGETTTTLSLDIRRLGERISRMERRGKNLNTLKQVGYKLLAYLVVLIMWIVWCLVSIIFVARGTIKGIVSSVKWLLWC